MTESQTPPSSPSEPPAGPAAPATNALLPGAGAPLVPGPPNSVRAPIAAGKVNAFFGISGVVVIVGVLILVIVGAVLVLTLFRPR